MKIVLIDGTRLADLIIEHGIGVTDTATYTLKRIDEDYFEGSPARWPIVGAVREPPTVRGRFTKRPYPEGACHAPHPVRTGFGASTRPPLESGGGERSCGAASGPPSG